MSARKNTEGIDEERIDGAKTSDKEGAGNVRQEEDNCRAAVWANERGPRFQAVYGARDKIGRQ